MHRAAVGLAIAALWASDAAALDRAKLIQLSASVLKIEVIRQQGGYSLGSGVVVADQKVVTNCHVTREARSIAVIKAGARWPVQAQAIDAKLDLCVLHVEGVRADAVPLGSTASLRIGQPVTAIGYTGGTGLQGSDGDIVALHRFEGSRVIQSTNWFNSGASGGGLFDERMRLVGILTFRMRGGEAHYFAAPVEWIQHQLTPSTRYEPVRPLAEAERAYWQLPPQEQPEFLQAATLARGAKWTELRALTMRWTHHSKDDPSAWYSRGIAEEALEQLPEALAAFERSVILDSSLADGWLRVGLLRARLGMIDKAREALRNLEPLNASLADQLSARIGSN